MREVGNVEFCGADRGAVGGAGGGGVCAAEVGSAGLNLAPPSVMPANAGTHARKDRPVVRVDPRVREDDGVPDWGEVQSRGSDHRRVRGGDVHG